MAELELGDGRWPHAEVGGGGSEGEVLRLPGWSQVAVVRDVAASTRARKTSWATARFQSHCKTRFKRA